MAHHKPTYEDAPEYPGAYSVRGWRGVAFRVYGWELEHRYNEPEYSGEGDEDDPSSYYYDDEGEDVRTGNLVCVMVGDDRRHIIAPDDLTLLKGSEYCRECGQIGCTCNAYDDEEAVQS